MQPEQPPHPVDVYNAIAFACRRWLFEAQTMEHPFTSVGATGLALNLYLVAVGARKACCIAWAVDTDWREGAGQHLMPLGFTFLESRLTDTLYVVKSATDPPRTTPEARLLLGVLFPDVEAADWAYTIRWVCDIGETELILWREPMKAPGDTERALVEAERERLQRALDPLNCKLYANISRWDIRP